MRPSKKNGFFNFCFAFIPGAAEMYMGFMKLGLSMMSIFALLIMIPGFFRLDDMFVVPAFVMWAYSFFHARNLKGCDDQIFWQLRDHYIWEEFSGESQFKWNLSGAQKWIAVVLILFGANMLWKYMVNLFYNLIPSMSWNQMYAIIDGIPSVVLGLGIIAAGIWLIVGKKKAMKQPEQEETALEVTDGENN